MAILRALVYAIVQGLTAFLPVSSSGHMVLVPFIAGWKGPSTSFGLAAHLAELAVLCHFFKDDLFRLWRAFRTPEAADASEKKLLRALQVASLPAIVGGALVAALASSKLHHPFLTSLLFGLMGYFLLTTESHRREREVDPVEGQKPLRTELQLEEAEALRIGFAQAVAVLPGISRTGTTIGEGLRRGMTRAGAVRFSFLLAIPVTAGAAVWQVPGAIKHFDATGFGVGLVFTAIASYFALKWAIILVTRRGLRGAGLWCFAAMVAGIVTSLARS